MRHALELAALEHGFPLAGAVDLELAREGLAEHMRRYDAWLARGDAGEMGYLARGRDRRADPTLVFSETKSVLCVALPYRRRPAGAASATEGPRYARYLDARDYHSEIAERLEAALRSAAGRLPPHAPALRWKVCVDTSAVLERAWAALAGLGWIGKNTLLIHPKLGSYLFIGVALVNQTTGQGPSPLPNLCGHCSRCLDGCPTKAFTAPGALDARRCISYWTLEKRGALELAKSDRRALGSWVAGCDVCQEVCPFNVKPARAEADRPDDAPSATALDDWAALLEETTEAYRSRTRDSALSRVKPAQFSRNLALALANAPAETLAAVAPRIERRLLEEADPAARDAWARCFDAACIKK